MPRDLNLNAVCRGVSSCRPYVNVGDAAEGRDASLVVPHVNIQIYYRRNTFILEISVPCSYDSLHLLRRASS